MNGVTLSGVTTVVLAEDDPGISEPLSRALQREGYSVTVVTDGTQVLPESSRIGADLIVLDLGLPGMDGLEVCRRIRDDGRDLPVLVLTARTDEVDFVVGLDAGADDYVGKPFRLAELMARVRALLRRRSPDVLEANGVRLDPQARRVMVDGSEVLLANKEFELLRVLLRKAGQVVTREEILREVWQDLETKTSKTLDMHMSWLRRKLGDGDGHGGPAGHGGHLPVGGHGQLPGGVAVGQQHGGRRIATVRGVGFRFNA